MCITGYVYSNNMSHRNCSLYEKVVLKAVVAEFVRSGLEEATLYQVFKHIAALCAMERMPTLKMSHVCLYL